MKNRIKILLLGCGEAGKVNGRDSADNSGRKYNITTAMVKSMRNVYKVALFKLFPLS